MKQRNINICLNKQEAIQIVLDPSRKHWPGKVSNKIVHADDLRESVIFSATLCYKFPNTTHLFIISKSQLATNPLSFFLSFVLNISPTRKLHSDKRTSFNCILHWSTMAMSRGTVIFLICVFIVCGLWVQDTNASPISNGAVRGDDDIHENCKTHPEAASCHPDPANKYTRGCEKETDCRPPQYG